MEKNVVRLLESARLTGTGDGARIHSGVADPGVLARDWAQFRGVNELSRYGVQVQDKTREIFERGWWSGATRGGKAFHPKVYNPIPGPAKSNPYPATIQYKTKVEDAYDIKRGLQTKAVRIKEKIQRKDIVGDSPYGNMTERAAEVAYRRVVGKGSWLFLDSLPDGVSVDTGKFLAVVSVAVDLEAFKNKHNPLPDRSLDTMSEAIAMSSPSGRQSERSRQAARQRLSTALFGPGGLQKSGPGEEQKKSGRLLQLDNMIKTYEQVYPHKLGSPKNNSVKTEYQRMRAEREELTRVGNPIPKRGSKNNPSPAVYGDVGRRMVAQFEKVFGPGSADPAYPVALAIESADGLKPGSARALAEAIQYASVAHSGLEDPNNAYAGPWGSPWEYLEWLAEGNYKDSPVRGGKPLYVGRAKAILDKRGSANPNFDKDGRLYVQSKGTKKYLSEFTLNQLTLMALKAFPSSPIQKAIQAEISKRREAGEQIKHYNPNPDSSTLDAAIDAAARDATHNVKFADWWKHYKAANRDANNLGQEELVQVVRTWNDRAWGNDGMRSSNPPEETAEQIVQEITANYPDLTINTDYTGFPKSKPIKRGLVATLHRMEDGQPLTVKIDDVTGPSVGKDGLFADRLTLQPSDMAERSGQPIEIRALRVVSKPGARAKVDHESTLIFEGVPGYSYHERVRLTVAKTYTYKSNPESAAASFYETFHGTPSTETVDVVESIHEHDNLTPLGGLRELVVHTLSGYKLAKTWGEDKTGDVHDIPFLCSSEDGNQLYIRGGDQTIDLDSIKMGPSTKWNKEKIVVGDIHLITYRTRKSFDKFKDIDYFHKLGEETRVRPTLVYDTRSQLMEIVGGQYHIDDPLIGVSRGIIN